MHRRERWAFFRMFLPGMVMLLIAYFFLTAYRDYRDNYMKEILSGIGYNKEKIELMFKSTERWVGLGVMVPLGLLFLIRENRWGVIGAYGIMLSGCAFLAGGTWMFQRGMINGEAWIIASGLGGYLTYVPFGSVLFDRLIAATHVVATAVYAIYVADAVGYLGSIIVQLYKDFFARDSSRLEFFQQFNYVMAGMGLILLLASLVYFLGKIRRARSPAS